MSGSATSASVRITAALLALSRRMLLLAALRGAVVGLVLGGVGLVVAWAVANGGYGGGWIAGAPGSGYLIAGWFLLALLAGLVVAIRGRLRAARLRGGTVVDAARLVEARVPGCRNIVLSAAEGLNATPGAPPPPRSTLEVRVRRLVVDEAAEWLTRHPPPTVISLTRPAGALAGSLLASLLLGFVVLGSLERGVAGSGGAREALAQGGPRGGEEGWASVRVEARILPPAYTGEVAVVVQDPESIEALRGSRLEVTVDDGTRGDSRGPSAFQGTLETLDGRRPLWRDASGRLRAEVDMDADGFLSLELKRGPLAVRRLIALGVVDDPLPRVRILEPGEDLYLPDGNRILRLEVEATDDRALASLDLLFTRVRGFGERFDFEEGRIPLRITRHASDRWTGSAAWNLGDLELERGDVLVYRAQARDERPGALPGESETWTLEIMGSDAAPAGGFAGEDEMTRYALSQQMVLVLTQALEAGSDTLSGVRLLEESRVLAAAQRRVRAEFVFMLGGELEDEHLHDDPAVELEASDHEAGHDHGAASGAGASPTGDPEAPSAQDLHEEAHARADADAAEGRLAQEGRIELARAIRAMSEAVTHLNQAALNEALDAEAVALEHLQRAFASSRYLLRALSEREELDPGRRLTGERSTAAPRRRSLLLAEPDPVEVEVRRILEGLLRLAQAPAPASSAGTIGPAGWAARLLAVDPTSPRVRTLASRLVELETWWPEGDVSAGQDGEDDEKWRRGIDEVVVDLGRYLRDRHLPHPGAVAPPGLRHLEGAWVDALRGATGEGGGR